MFIAWYKRWPILRLGVLVTFWKSRCFLHTRVGLWSGKLAISTLTESVYRTEIVYLDVVWLGFTWSVGFLLHEVSFLQNGMVSTLRISKNERVVMFGLQTVQLPVTTVSGWNVFFTCFLPLREDQVQAWVKGRHNCIDKPVVSQGRTVSHSTKREDAIGEPADLQFRIQKWTKKRLTVCSVNRPIICRILSHFGDLEIIRILPTQSWCLGMFQVSSAWLRRSVYIYDYI